MRVIHSVVIREKTPSKRPRIRSKQSVMDKLFFIMTCVSTEAVVVRAITGVSGPASDRSSVSFP